MKKTYINPRITVVKYEPVQIIASSSDPDVSIETTSDSFVDGGSVLSTGNSDIWNSWDEE